VSDQNLPVSPPSSAKLRAQDLELLQEDARRFVVRDRPATDALWLALMKPRDVVLREYQEALQRNAQIGQGASMMRDPYGRPLGEGPPAIQAFATALVAKAILGDSASQGLLMERIEGRTTPRKMSEDEAAESRANMIAGIEAVVREMNAVKRTGTIIDVTPEKKTNGSANGEDHS